MKDQCEKLDVRGQLDVQRVGGEGVEPERTVQWRREACTLMLSQNQRPKHAHSCSRDAQLTLRLGRGGEGTHGRSQFSDAGHGRRVSEGRRVPALRAGQGGCPSGCDTTARLTGAAATSQQERLLIPSSDHVKEARR